MLRHMALFALSVAIVGATVAAAAPTRAPACPPRHVKVIAAGGAARAYRKGVDLYGCYPGHRPVHFGVAKDREGASPYGYSDSNITIAGRYLGFQERNQRDDNSLLFRVYVVDLKARRTVVSADTGDLVNPPQPGDAGIGRASILAVNSGGFIAWIVRDAYSGDGHREVWVAGPRVKANRLASGTTIDRNYLRITPTNVIWRSAGSQEHASLTATGS